MNGEVGWAVIAQIVKVAHQPLHSSIRVNWEFSSNYAFLMEINCDKCEEWNSILIICVFSLVGKIINESFEGFPTKPILPNKILKYYLQPGLDAPL